MSNSSGIARGLCAVAVCWSVGASVGCDKHEPAVDAIDRHVASANTDPEPAHAHDASSAGSAPAAAPSDAGANPAATTATTAANAVLTVRIVNAGDHPLPLAVAPDLNEMLHARRMGDRRSANPEDDSTRVKFFPVGQMALCTQAQGAGYGGIGRPERRALQPNETLDFYWDGQQRNEVLQPGRGVCQQLAAPAPGRYRFELDQPYDTPRCNQPTFDWPLAADAPRVLEFRCVARPATHHG